MTDTICTLTMNPALDLATETERVVPTHKLRCDSARHDPGGGGINVARVIHSLGGQAHAVYPAGGPTGELLTQLLEGAGIRQVPVPIAGLTRENVTVNETSSGREFRFVLPGPALSADEQQRCLKATSTLTPRPEYLVASGSLPPGVPPAFYARLARQARQAGVKLVLDTSGEALREAAREGVYLLKPNLRELSGLVGRELGGEDDRLAAVQGLLAAGSAEIIVLSLGAEGALLVSEQGSVRLPALEVPVRSTVGAGDTMVGALVHALARGWRHADALRLGLAAAAATLLLPGTALCRREDVDRLYAASTEALRDDP